MEEAPAVRKKLSENIYQVKHFNDKKSEVWKTFGVVINSQTTEQMGFVECKNCKSLLKYHAQKTGTSQLKRHKCSTVRNETSIKSFFLPNPTKLPSNVEEEVVEKCMKMCVQDIRPFSAVSGEGFKALAQTFIRIGSIYGNVDAKDIIPCPTTLSRQVVKNARKQRLEIIPEIREVLQKGVCAATTDMWTDDYRKLSYISLTVHYVTDNWHLKKRVLFTSNFPNERKTGENIRKQLLSIFTDLGLDMDLFQSITFVTDQGANIMSALQPYKRLNCCSHMLNTVLRNSFDPRFLQEEAADILETLTACKELVTFMKQSGNVTKLKKTLHQDVETRWNTKLKMLVSVYEQYDDIATVLREKNDLYRISKINLLVLKSLVQLLEPFKEASDALEAEKVPTLHMALLWCHRLLSHVTSTPSNIECGISKLKQRAKFFLETKFKLDVLHKVATFLWPRFRQLRMLSSEETNEVVDYIKGKLSSGNNSGVSVSDSEPLCKKTKSDFSDWEDISKEEKIDEVSIYMNLTYENNSDLLSWWEKNSRQCPQLARIAKRVLSIPASSASCERNFSTAGRLIEERRTNLKPETVDSILFLHDNIWS